ncbi:amidohydrolase family protein [Alteribacillus sp. HJP-4]|uniref:amidohydrolase family protein n=1 Tax=Alteribacillus sp. HJP-4 TaxID=2775394 RepID=UPI0035CD371D
MKIFDAHFHIIDPRYPIIENQGYTPPAYTGMEYIKETAPLDISGGAIVSGSFQGYDQTYLIDTLAFFGKEYVGVTQLPPDTDEKEIEQLHEKGVRAVRFNVKRGDGISEAAIEKLARLVYETAGWHAEFYAESSILKKMGALIQRLPKASIDHLGLTKEGFPELVKLAAAGVRVKATGFGRTEVNVPQAILSIFRENPDALLFGTDLPSTRAPRPFQHSDIELIVDTLGERNAKRVLSDNARHWYGLERDY